MAKGKCILFILFSCFNWFTIIFAQPDPITIQFVEAQPMWEHLVYDTNYYDVGIQPDINKYTVMHPKKCFRFNQDLIVLSYCVNYNGEIYGYILEQLDIMSGETKWQNFSTYYNDGLQDVYHDIYMRPDGQLEAIGMKRHGPYIDTFFGNWGFGLGKSNYVRKIFDYTTGELIHTFIGSDSIGQILPQDLTFFPSYIDSTYLNIQFSLTEVDSTFKLFTDFYQIDGQLNVVGQIPIGSVPYEDVGTTVFSFNQPQLFRQINDSTIVGLFFKDRFKLGEAKSGLLWIDIQDNHNIHVVRTLETTDLIPVYKQSFAFFNFENANGRLYIMQPFKDPNNGVNTSFLTVIGEDGQLLHHLPICIDNEHNYSYFKLLYSTDASDYFVARPSRTGRSGLDIVKLDKNSDSIEFISSLTSANSDEEFTRELTVATMYDDSIVIFGAYTKKIGEVQNSAVKYYAFNSSDLGIDLMTKVKEVDQTELFKIYPNPTSGYVRFDFNKTISGNIIIYDQIGMKVGNYPFENTDFYEVELNELASGVYYAQIIEPGYMPSAVYAVLRLSNEE